MEKYSRLYLNLYRYRVSPESLAQLREELWKESGFTIDFAVLTMSSCVIASIGLLMNSAAVIIGAMIIAPLMMPLRGLALAALDADNPLIRRSLTTLALGTLLALLLSYLIGFVFHVPAISFRSEILARTQPNLADLLVAIVAGGISGFAKVRRRISDALAGTAIAVALMPPLCVVGIALSQGYLMASGGAFLLYATNFIGITLACLLIFAIAGYYVSLRKVGRAILQFFLMTAILIIPLFLSLYRLVQQARLEAAIREQLQQETITVGQQTELNDLKIFWNTFPWQRRTPVVVLHVQANEPVTPRQVYLVQEFLRKRFGRPFILVFRVSAVQSVTADEPSPETPDLTPFLMDQISPSFPSHPILK